MGIGRCIEIAESVLYTVLSLFKIDDLRFADGTLAPAAR